MNKVKITYHYRWIDGDNNDYNGQKLISYEFTLKQMVNFINANNTDPFAKIIYWIVKVEKL